MERNTHKHRICWWNVQKSNLHIHRAQYVSISTANGAWCRGTPNSAKHSLPLSQTFRIILPLSGTCEQFRISNFLQSSFWTFSATCTQHIKLKTESHYILYEERHAWDIGKKFQTFFFAGWPIFTHCVKFPDISRTFCSTYIFVSATSALQTSFKNVQNRLVSRKIHWNCVTKKPIKHWRSPKHEVRQFSSTKMFSNTFPRADKISRHFQVLPDKWPPCSYAHLAPIVHPYWRGRPHISQFCWFAALW